MLYAPYLRQLIQALGGTPMQNSIPGLLRELVTALGGTPTKYAQKDLLKQAIAAAGGAPTPTPTPAPVFTTQPSISPAGGTANSTTFTANDGAASNATGYTRRWLLSGSAIGTGTTVAPVSAGSLVLEVTATGAGGSTIANSPSVVVASPTPTPAPITLTKLHEEGDSITYGPDSYADRWNARQSGITITKPAFSGAVIGASGDAAGTNSLYGRKQQLFDAAPQAETVLIGANDLGLVYNNATNWLNALYGYLTVARGGVTGVKIGVGGVLEVSETTGGHQGRGTVLNPLRLQANAALRATVGDKIDFYIPFGDATDQAWATNSNNLEDGLHPNRNGKDLMDRIFSAVMDPIVTKATGSTPAAFSVTDQNNVPTGTTIERSFLVTGLGMGQTQTFSVSNGLVARGIMGNPTPASSVVAMNGDMIRWRVQASATADTPIVSTMTAGSRSATFTVRSAKATGNVTFASGSDTGNAAYFINRAVGNTPYNFPAVNFPEGRPIVILDMRYTLVSSVTVNGIALQQVNSANASARLMAFVAPAGTDLAPGSYPVVITTSNNGSCVLWPGAVKGSTNATASVDFRRIPFGNKLPQDQSAAALDVPSGGLSVSFMTGQVGKVITFPDATVERTYATSMDTQEGNETQQVGRWVTTGQSIKPTFANYENAITGMFTMLFLP